jgi:hypothetical protein
MKRTVTIALQLLVLVLAGMPATVSRAAPVRLAEEDWVRLEIQPVCVDGDETTTFEARILEIPPGRTASLVIPLPWPDPGSRGKLRLEAHGGPVGGDLEFVLESEWSPAAARPARAVRKVTVEDGGTRLVEVFARDRLHLTLAVRAEHVRKPVVSPPRPGRSVRFRLGVERLVEGATQPLESNDLDTLVGESVSYSFRRGEGDTLETLRLRLRPTRIMGEIVEVEVTFEGSLHSLGSPLYLNRREKLLTSRDAPTMFDAASGDPPTGYRFRITPEF